jgi:DNA gyrase/topoisomerase IV subunit B
VVQITVEDIQKADDLFDILMGKSVPPRREYILKYSEDAEI